MRCSGISLRFRSASPLLAPVMTTTLPAISLTLSPVLLVADFLHPVDSSAVEPLLNGDVRHGCRGCRAVPMLLARRERDHVAGSNLLDGAAPALRAAAARRDDERLAERMRMPRRSRTGLERDTGGDRPSRLDGFEQRVEPYRAGEVFVRALPRRLRSTSLDVHDATPSAPDHSLQVLGVPIPMHRDLRGGAVDLTKIV